jgi:hypothetical protein
MIQCSSQVNRDAVRRVSIGGIEHIIFSSFTLPDNVVMNGGLYPAEEIAASFSTLERTLAPVEHPTDGDGNFLSASDPVAIHNFHAGAFNMNVSQEGGRIHVEKHINVQEALKSERGKRLLDRINELETNDSPRPIHTSTGVFLEVEQLDAPQTNADGDEYTWVARNMVFDHDAILLDSVAAATPDKGVGMAVNGAEQVEVERCVLNVAQAPARPAPRDMRSNAEGMSFSKVMEDLQGLLRNVVAGEWIYLVDVFDEEAIFETPQGFFSVPWRRSGEQIELAGVPIRVDKQVSYTPKVNSKTNDGGKKMKKKIIAALNAAGVATDGLDDDQLMEKYNELITANAAPADPPDKGSVDADAIANAVQAAVQPLTEQVTALAENVNKADTDELNALAELVGNSDKYPAIDAEAAKTIPLATLKDMAALCKDASGLPLTHNNGSDGADGFDVPTEMPA